MIRCVTLTLALTLSTAAAGDFASPDKQATAYVRTVGNEAIVAFRDSASKSVLSDAFLSGDDEHGLTFEQGKWTPDSKFFIFTMSSSGGHSSWHARTFVYQRDSNDLLMLDGDFIKPVVDPEFKVSSPSFLTIKIIDTSLPEPIDGKWITIDLAKTLKNAAQQGAAANP